jgi:hypothetical protein
MAAVLRVAALRKRGLVRALTVHILLRVALLLFHLFVPVRALRVQRLDVHTQVGCGHALGRCPSAVVMVQHRTVRPRLPSRAMQILLVKFRQSRHRFKFILRAFLLSVLRPS